MTVKAKKVAVFAAAIVLLVIAGFLAVAVGQYGGIDEVLQLPATLDVATPSNQDGFSLIAVTRGRQDDSDYSMPNGAKMFLAAPQGSGDTILWIAPPVLPPPCILPTDTDVSGKSSSFYDVEAASSAGDRFELPWHYEGGCLVGGGEPCISTRTATTSPQLIAVVIPSGYPADTTYFDVSIADPYQHKALWRIVRLPKMRLVSDGPAKSAFNYHGVSVSLTAFRSRSTPTASPPWPTVQLTMNVQALPQTVLHHWALFELRNSEPTLSWQPYRMPWVNETFDESNQRSLNVFWMFDRNNSVSVPFSTIASPYVRENGSATFRGVLSEYETRVDSVHIKNVSVEGVRAPAGGSYQLVYCISLPHSRELISGSGLTFDLPAQHMSAKKFLFMSPNCLNLLWHLRPVTPGHNSDTAAYLPDSPLCKEYHRPASVWFEGFADGVPLGICAGLPEKANQSLPIMVRFPAPFRLPSKIHDLKITVHQRVDLLRLPVTLTAPIHDAN